MEGLLTGSRGAPGEGQGAPRYRLRASVELFPASDGDLYLIRAGAPAIAVRRPTDEDREVLEMLASDGIERIDDPRWAARLEPLLAAGLLVREPDVRRLSPRIAERFGRQLLWFAETGDAVATQQTLRETHVVVLGCGGLGTWALAALGCLGVGRYTIADPDVVETGNLNRQVLYTPADIGRPKVDSVCDWLRRFDPDVRTTAVRRRVDGPDDVAALLDGATALILAADWPPYILGRWVNEACVAARVPFITAGQQPPVLKVGPTYAPGAGPCFACHERQLAAAHPLYAEIAAQRARKRAPDTTLGPAAGVVGTMLALDLMTLLTTGAPPATLGRALIMDMITLEQRWETIERDPACPACAALS